MNVYSVNSKYINSSETEKCLNFFEFVLIIFFTAYCILPAVSAKIGFVYVLALAVIYAVLTALCDNELSTPVLSFMALALFLAAAYYFLVKSTGISIYSQNYGLKKFLSKFNEYFMMFFPGLLAARLIRKGSFKQMCTVLAAAGCFIIFVIYKTLREMNINPDVAKQFSVFNETAGDNIANYYFVYSIPVIIVLLTAYFFYIKNPVIKLVLVGSVVFLFYFIIQAQYTLALLISFIGVLYESFKKIKNIRMKAVVFALSLILLFFVPAALKFAAERVSSEQMAIRLTELYNFFTSGDSSGYNLNGRLTLYWKSIKAFLHSPIIGNSSLDFNGHATLLVVPAELGLLGLIPLYYMCFKMNSYIKALLKDKAYLFAPVFLMLILMGLTNPINSSTSIAAASWMIAPVSIYALFDSGKTGFTENEAKENDE